MDTITAMKKINGYLMINNYKSSHVESLKSKAPWKDGFYTYVLLFAMMVVYTRMDGNAKN